jgi:hypothetical protein
MPSFNCLEGMPELSVWLSFRPNIPLSDTYEAALRLMQAKEEELWGIFETAFSRPFFVLGEERDGELC